MSKGKVLVTGGTGYIGSHTTVELLQSGYEVVIVDNLENSNKNILDGIREITGKYPVFKQADIRDYDSLKKLLNEHNDITSVIHFAAYKAVGESHETPLMYYDNNINGLINLLKACRNTEIKNFVFSSSCTVYGEPDELPVTENAKIKEAISPYGNTKRISEEILRDVSSKKEYPETISLRYFNPVGAHPSAKIGELPQGVPNNLMPFVTQTALGIRKQLKIFGNDYSTPDGTCIRDYINVVDLSKAHIAALERLADNKNENPFEYFNIGTGKGVSVLEIVKSFESVSGLSLNYAFAPRRQGDVESVYADTKKANDILGWKAEKTLDETIKSAWEWEKNYRNK